MYNDLGDDTFVSRGGKSSGVTINYAGYLAATNVQSHAGIDYDQQALEKCYSNYADMSEYLSTTTVYGSWQECAIDIYTNGQGAGTSNPSSSRTLKVGSSRCK